MKCLLRYNWVKLPRDTIPRGKGVMGFWAKLASRAAFRPGKSRYCGHSNYVASGEWAGGMVGLKAILGVKSRQQAMDIMGRLSTLGYISFNIAPDTKKLSYQIKDWVVSCNGLDCGSGAVYTTEGYGFLCLPRTLTKRLAEAGHTFNDADAMLDLWCHTVWQDPRNAFSYVMPSVQYGRFGIALTLDTLGARWGWEKTKVWRFFQKHEDAFALHKLPGSYGCLIFNKVYPSAPNSTGIPASEILRILNEIRIMGENTYLAGPDNHRINQLIGWYSSSLPHQEAVEEAFCFGGNRVAHSPLNIRAYFSDCWNCSNTSSCLVTGRAKRFLNNQIRGPCHIFVPRFHHQEASYEKQANQQ